MEDIGYLIGALGDGGLYYLRYKGKRSEYRDDKRRRVYVVEVPHTYASQFYSIIKPEHPKLGVDTGPHPRKVGVPWSALWRMIILLD
jgi:hypothetical protein